MNVIETRKLTRKFGAKEAVSGLDLSVKEGGIYALLGPNGAGKTTTLRTLMNILSPSEGEASVLGADSRWLSPTEFAQIGYVSENQDMPEWMTVGNFLDYCRSFYPSWDRDFEGRLLGQFGLEKDKRLKDLSRGTRMKAALLSSLAYHPRLLVLDEPFSGLDPLVRDEFVQGILELSDQEKWTVLVSSHDVDEVERLADTVGILNEGKLFLSESTEALQGRFRQVALRLPSGGRLPDPAPSSWIQVEREGDIVKFVESAYREGTWEKEIRGVLPQAEGLAVTPLSLREIFVVLARVFRLPVSGGKS